MAQEQKKSVSLRDSKDARLRAKLRAELGPAVIEALEDPAVVEVILNADGRLWVERHGEPMQPAGSMTAANALSLLGTIASALDTVISRDAPVLEGELLLDGSRIEGIVPPITAAPIFAIRKRATLVFSLQQYVDEDIMTAAQRDQIARAVADKRNILVVGGTGTGKTTLVNAIIREMAEAFPDQRLVVLEDTTELQVQSPNHCVLRTSMTTSMQDLLRATMRLRPDRILVGEVRGAEALALLKAWNTGHSGGVATVHANDSLAALTRLEQLVAEGGLVQGRENLIGEAVDLVVTIQRAPTGRRVGDLLRVTGYSYGEYLTEAMETNNG